MSDVPLLTVPLLSPTSRLVSLPPIHLREARTGEPPRLKTSVRVGHRGGILYVRFDGRDEATVATYTRRDDPLWLEDVFEVFLTPHEPSHVYYEFEVNPLGTLFDARVHSPKLRRESLRVETAWDCADLESRVTVRPRRWSALLKIPLAPMNDATVSARWRANFYRVDRGSVDEYSAWSPPLTDPPEFHLPERFGVLELSL